MAEEGLSFGDVFQAIRKRSKIVLATVVLAVLFCVVVEFLYNPLASSYSIGFVLSYPGSSAQKYPDGTPFHYQDMISEETLRSLKEENGLFEDIDIQALLKEDGLTVTADVPETGPAAGQTNHYTLSVKGSFLRDRESATELLFAVARRSRKRIIESAESINFTLDAATFENADFADQIALLAQQRDTILEQYDEWISLYRGSYAVAGKTLANRRAESAIAFGTTLEAALLEELGTNGYVPVEELPARKAALQKEKEENERTIERLLEAYGGGGYGAVRIAASAAAEMPAGDSALDLSQMLASLYARNVRIDSQIAALTEENVNTFEAQLKAAFDRMNTDRLASDGTVAESSVATVIRNVGKELYTKECRVDFDTSRVIREGGIGLTLNIICGIIFGFLAACFGAGIAVLLRSRRRKRTEPAPQAEGAASEENAEETEEGAGAPSDEQ